MLLQLHQRGLCAASIKCLAPLLASCSSSGQLAAAAGCSATAAPSPPAAAPSQQPALLVRRGFQTGVWDVRRDPKGMMAKRDRRPYFHPQDGPQAYLYWEDMWRRHNPRQKRAIPTHKPLYLEQQQQDALCEAAVSAGLPAELVYGNPNKHGQPRLIDAIYKHGPRWGRPQQQQRQRCIPYEDPAELRRRIKGLLGLQNSIPGLDVVQILYKHGLGLLAQSPERVSNNIRWLGLKLQEAGVQRAEPGVLFTVAPFVAGLSSTELVKRARAMPEVFTESVGHAPQDLLSHPQHAVLLRRSSMALRTNLAAMKNRLGPEAAAQVVAQMPLLAGQNPGNLDAKAALLARSFPGFKEQPDKALKLAASLLRREPKLMSHSAAVLHQRLEGLSALLGLGDRRQRQRQRQQQRQLAVLLGRQPSLLHKKTETLQGKLEHLQQVLGGISAAAAARLAKQQPQLLCFSTEALSRPLAALQQLADDSPLAPLKAKAAAVCLRQPRLLTLPASGAQSLAGRLELLQQLAASSPAGRDRVGELAAAAEGGQVKEAAAVLGHPMLVQRLTLVLQQQQQQQQQQTAGGGAAEVPGLLPLLQLPQEDFAEKYGAEGAAAESAS